MKKSYIIAGGLVIIFIVFYWMFKKKLTANKNLSDGTISTDKELLEVVKRIYILETANYTSNIFKQTNGAGIISFNSSFPYGWTMLKSFWEQNPDFAPVGVYASSNGYSYLKFPSVLAGQKAVAEIVKKRFNDGLTVGAYFSLNSDEAADYVRKLLSISLPESEKIRPNKYLQV